MDSYFINAIKNGLQQEVLKKEDLENIFNSYAQDTTKSVTFEGINAFTKDAKNILKLLLSGEEGLKLNLNKNIRANSSLVAKNKNIILFAMKNAYSLIMRFREYITKTNIEYLVQYESSDFSALGVLNLEEILNSITGLSTMRGGGLKLNISSAKIKNILQSKEIAVFDDALVSRVKQVLEQIIALNKDENGKILTQIQFNKLRQKYTKTSFSSVQKRKDSFINQGYALEAALKLVLDNKDIDGLLSLDVKYAAYFDAIKNTAVFRGMGDLEEEYTNKLKNFKKDFDLLQNAAQLQVKRFRANVSAQLVTLDSLIAELTSIIIITKHGSTHNIKQLKKMFEKYFTSSMKSSKVLEKTLKIAEKKIKNDPEIKELIKLLEGYGFK